MNLLWKLLRSHISPLQVGGFFLANLTGMFIVLLCVQIYSDIRPMFGRGNSYIKKDYLVVTKKISTLGTVFNKSATFTEAETDEIRQQAFARNVGKFTASGYSVEAGFSMGGAGFSTEMFFESVPDEYIDMRPVDWQFVADEGLIPIILPRNYLNLYNFGFAQSRGLPKVSEGMLGLLRLDIELSGNGKREDFKGRIAGFSDRLNTILVPEKFMEWANQRYAPNKTRLPSRLIVETMNPSDKLTLDFFRDKGYELEDGRLDSGRLLWFLNLIILVVSGIGLLICVLSVYILLLSVTLILQKNKTKLENLLLLGFSVKQVSAPYQRLVSVLNGIVVLVAISLVTFVRYLYISWLGEAWPEFQSGGMLLVVAIGVIFYAFITGVNIVAIRRKVRGACSK